MRRSSFRAASAVALVFSLFALSFNPFPAPLFAAENASLEKGIAMFQRENNDEAAALLEKARQEDPSDTRAAYYLGMAYKRLQRYPDAKKQLLDAVTMSPKIKEAVLELVEVLYQLNDTDEAKKWLDVAEKESIRPAQTAFLKGLVLLKGDDVKGSIDAFQQSKALDKSMEQAADYQIGVAYLKEKSLNDAQKALKEVILLDPNADVSAYANEYVRAIERKREADKSVHLSVGVFGEYDDNVILKPNETSSVQIDPAAKKADWREVATVDADWSKRVSDRFGIKLLYDLYYANQDSLNQFDVDSHTIGAVPSFYIKDTVISVPVQYNYTWVDGDDFLWMLTVNPLVNFKVADDQLGQISFKVEDKSFLHAPVDPNEDRDATRMAPGFGWFYFFSEQGFFVARYEWDTENTDGSNWDYDGNRVTASLQVPVPAVDRLKFTVAGDAYFQDFKHTNTLFNVKRSDDSYTLSTMLSYSLWKQAELQLRYTYIRHKSNISFYDYDRNVYSSGIVFKF